MSGCQVFVATYLSAAKSHIPCTASQSTPFQRHANGAMRRASKHIAGWKRARLGRVVGGQPFCRTCGRGPAVCTIFGGRVFPPPHWRSQDRPLSVPEGCSLSTENAPSVQHWLILPNYKEEEEVRRFIFARLYAFGPSAGLFGVENLVFLPMCLVVVVELAIEDPALSRAPATEADFESCVGRPNQWGAIVSAVRSQRVVFRVAAP